LAAQQQSPTRRSLLTEARHVVLPAGICSSGWPAVRETSRQIGVEYDPWQADFNRAVLAKDAGGSYAADTAVMSVCRQAGKTFDIGGLIFADSIIHPRTTTVWTAHRFKVARETFDQLRGLARSRLLAPHIDYDDITTGAGNESIPFRNGSRIVFAARERGAIRGFSKVRRLILDEAQILTDAALSDLAPTMNQALNPQLILTGTPPKPTDPGEVFVRLRTEALAAQTTSVLYVEFSADQDADPDDREQWGKANPSYPTRTPEAAIERLRRILTEGDFRREALGVWDDTESPDIFGAGAWEACAVDPQPANPMALGIACDRDLTHTSLAAAVADEDRMTVQLLAYAGDTAGVVDRVRQWQRDQRMPVVVDGRSPAAVLIPMLEAARVKLTITRTPDYLDACAGFLALVRDAKLAHGGFPELDRAVAAVRKRNVGERWAWGRPKDGSADISPLEAATLAVWAAQTPQRKAEPRIRIIGG
jgi:hypothetical protein